MKKKLNIILIVAVTALWGVVGYRFVSNYFYEPSQIITPSNKQIAVNSLNAERDTFLLSTIERDPFLNRIAIKNTAVAKRQTGKRFTADRKPKEIISASPWPSIQYYGYIKSGNEELFLLKINGKMNRMHKKESISGITIGNVYKDSILIIFNKEKKVYKH